MTTTIKWEGSGTKLPSGHTIFETHDNGDGEAAWAIADRSGKFPDTTDDGILWLDFECCLNASTRHAPVVPLRHVSGQKVSTPVDTPTILMLSKMFNWTIRDEVRGHFYKVS